jgi:hypothetical protein
MTHDDEATVHAAVGTPVDQRVVPLVPERVDACAQGCNGCDDCTDYDDYDYDDSPRDLTCTHCSGTGGDPWNGGITPCEHCDGEGYEWWN